MRHFLILILLYASLAFSQQEASVWYFGGNAGLKFLPDNTVLTLSDGQLSTEEGCSSIADLDGNLLFYTDGRTVWDKNHLPMPNANYASGTGLFGDASSTQSGIIVPKPGDPNIYYIFTVDEPHHENAAIYPNAFAGTYTTVGDGSVPNDDDGLNRGLNYSIVDLSVVGNNGSLGNIISANNHLVTYDTNPSGSEIKYKCSEKITAVKNEAGNFYWVVTHFRNRFYSFKISEDGVAGLPIVSQLGPDIVLEGYRRNAQGYLKASPDGTKLAIAHAQNGTVSGQATFNAGSVLIYDFDVNSGVVSNEKILKNNIQPYGVEFSPSSSFVYATYRDGSSVNMTLSQFDYQTPIVTENVIFNNDNYLFALQLAPNGKIYCANGYSESLGVINAPDMIGQACNYLHHNQALALGKQVKLGLPPFISSFLQVSFQVQDLCLGNSTKFFLSNQQNLISVQWNFGDGNLSSQTEPEHIYISPGDYSVSVVAVYPSGTATFTRVIHISVPPQSFNIVDKYFCWTGDENLMFSQFDSDVLAGQSSNDYGVTYFATAADAQQSTAELSSSMAASNGDYTFYARIFSISNPNCFVVSPFVVHVTEQPEIGIINSHHICSPDGQAVNIDLNEVLAATLQSFDTASYSISYHANQLDAQSNANSLPSEILAGPGTHILWLRVAHISNQNCFDIASFEIVNTAIPVANKPDDSGFCDNDANGIQSITLNSYNAIILGNQSPGSFNITYHLSLDDANQGFDPISQYDFPVEQTEVFVRIENVINPSCYSVTSFFIELYTLPSVVLEPLYALCDGASLTISLPPGFVYQWSTGSTTATTTISESGDYSVIVIQDNSLATCPATLFFEVVTSLLPQISEIIVHDWTASDNAIEVAMSTQGNYLYSIDGINFQNENWFTGLTPGQYTLTVKDAYHCGQVSEDFYILMYPKFFTPNFDGYNDFWQIYSSQNEPNMEISIFDRYGKLITSFLGSSIGWDGSLNGQSLPSTDYWFVVKRNSGKFFRGHFSLKR